MLLLAVVLLMVVPVCVVLLVSTHESQRTGHTSTKIGTKTQSEAPSPPHTSAGSCFPLHTPVVDEVELVVTVLPVVVDTEVSVIEVAVVDVALDTEVEVETVLAVTVLSVTVLVVVPDVADVDVSVFVVAVVAVVEMQVPHRTLHVSFIPGMKSQNGAASSWHAGNGSATPLQRPTVLVLEVVLVVTMVTLVPVAVVVSVAVVEVDETHVPHSTGHNSCRGVRSVQSGWFEGAQLGSGSAAPLHRCAVRLLVLVSVVAVTTDEVVTLVPLAVEVVVEVVQLSQSTGHECRNTGSKVHRIAFSAVSSQTTGSSSTPLHSPTVFEVLVVPVVTDDAVAVLSVLVDVITVAVNEVAEVAVAEVPVVAEVAVDVVVHVWQSAGQNDLSSAEISQFPSVTSPVETISAQ